MLGYIFPGQGAQFVGMGKDLYENFPVSKKIFDEADEALGFKISEICFNGPQDKLTSTENAQPAILTTSIAVLEAFKERNNLQPKFCAGLSLGEYSALVAAEVLSFEDAVYLVRKRGQFMEEAAKNNPGRMLSIIGLERSIVESICREIGCEIANLNCPGQIVISGKAANIEKAMELVKAKGAKGAILLDVSGAFHSSLMEEARAKLAAEIRKVKFNPAKVPLVSNVTAKAETDPEIIVQNLIKQVSSSTYWEDSIKYMAEQRVDCFLEIGPGVVLKGLNKRINPQIKTYNLGNVEEINAFSLDRA
jgi:[acyl-carrier-protein] S-malonyltransferase